VLSRLERLLLDAPLMFGCSNAVFDVSCTRHRWIGIMGSASEVERHSHYLYLAGRGDLTRGGRGREGEGARGRGAVDERVGNGRPGRGEGRGGRARGLRPGGAREGDVVKEREGCGRTGRVGVRWEKNALAAVDRDASE